MFLSKGMVLTFMDNVVLLNRSLELEQLSRRLGFQETIFLENIAWIDEKEKKKLGKAIEEARRQKKLIVYRAFDEELLRLVLEKMAVDIVIGVEQIHAEDSVHYLRGGLDQILCKIAADRGVVLGFSFRDILENKHRGKLLGRMRFNARLCKKYGVKTFMGNFSQEKMEMRSKKDLEAWKRLLEQ